MSTGRKRKQSAKKLDEDDDEPTAKRNKGCDRRLCHDVYPDPPYCFCKAADRYE